MPNYTGYQASVYPSGQITTVKRFEIPCFAASDIWQGCPVRLASSGDWTVQMCVSSAEKPLGVARDFAAAGDAVSVFDDGNIVRSYPGAGASFAREMYVGVVGTSSGVHPKSGAVVTYGVIGAVVPGGTTLAGASQTAVWAVGMAFESAALNDQAAYRIEPRVLSGYFGTVS